jgi:O-Antigen ligase
MHVGFEVLTREEPMLKKFLSFDNWTKLAVFYLWSSLFIGKVSAYIGLAIGGLLLFGVRVFWDRWYTSLTRPGDPLNGLGWAFLVSLVYGVAQAIYGIVFQGFPVFTTLQILVFNICPVFLFLGIWVGIRHPDMVRTYIRFLAWFTVIYAPLYFLFFRNLNLTLTGILPGTGLDLLSNPGSGTLALLGLLTLEPNLARFWLPILVLILMTIANQGRSDWLGLGICLGIWGKLSGKLGRVFGILGCIAAVLIIAAMVDLKLPPIPGRGGELSARGTIARMAGAISPELAAEAGGRDNSQFYYGTVHWREHWWAAIRNEVFTDPKREIFGLGYGYPLAQLAGPEVVKQGTRSPHNIFYFTLAYSGFVGVAIFFWFEICVLWLVWRAYKVSGVAFGLIFAVHTLIGAFFGNVFETPAAAIPYFLLCGMAVGPIFIETDQAYDDEQPVPAHVAELV